MAVAMLLIARLSSVPEFGTIGAVLSTATFGVALADLGLASFIVRARTLRETENVECALQVSALTSVSFALLGIGVLGATVHHGFPKPLFAVPVAFALDNFTDTAVSISVPDQQNHIIPASVGIRRTLLLAGVVLLAILTERSSAAVLSTSMLISSVGGLVHASSWLGRLGLRPRSHGRMGATLAQAWPYAVSTVSASARSLDTAIVTWCAGPLRGGFYSAASRMVGPFGLLTGPLSQILLPWSVGAGTDALRRTARRLVTLHLALVMLFVGSSPLVEPLTTFVLGHRYTSAAPTVAIVLAVCPLVNLAPPLESLLLAHGRARTVALLGFVFSLVTIGSIAAASLSHGSVGAAIALGMSAGLKCISLVIVISSLGRGAHSSTPAGV